MEPNYLNLDVNEDVKSLAVEFGLMNHFVKPLIQFVRMSDEQAMKIDIEDNLLQVYLHALKAQKILNKVEDKLEAFNQEL